MDQCKACVLKGDLKSCLATDCTHHGNWFSVMLMEIYRQQKAEISKLKAMIENGVGFEDLENDITYPCERR